jgi:hypothetical protein
MARSSGRPDGRRGLPRETLHRSLQGHQRRREEHLADDAPQQKPLGSSPARMASLDPVPLQTFLAHGTLGSQGGQSPERSATRTRANRAGPANCANLRGDSLPSRVAAGSKLFFQDAPVLLQQPCRYPPGQATLCCPAWGLARRSEIPHDPTHCRRHPPPRLPGHRRLLQLRLSAESRTLCVPIRAKFSAVLRMRWATSLLLAPCDAVARTGRGERNSQRPAPYVMGG